jgi:hypothetical protein
MGTQGAFQDNQIQTSTIFDCENFLFQNAFQPQKLLSIFISNKFNKEGF